MPWFVAIAATLILGLGAAGCGGSSKSSSTSTAAITKSELLAKGNAICTRGNHQLANAEKTTFGGKQPKKSQLSSFVTTSFAPIIQGQIDGIRALGAPPRDQATVTKILDAAQHGLNVVKSNPAVLAGGQDSFANFRKLAGPYGLTACAAG
jgi:hypothetical protein